MPVAAQAEAPREKGAERRNIPSSSPAGLLEEALLQLSAQLEGSIRINSVSTSGPLPPPGWNNLLRGASPVLTPALPLAYATCTSKADVVACVSFAVKHKLKVHAKGEMNRS